MKEQIITLIDWLDQTHTNSRAREALRALATELLKRVESPDPAQRRFDAEAIAQAADAGRGWNFESAKRWLNAADMPVFLSARQEDLFSHFRQKGHHEYPALKKTETSGRHRAEWYFELLPLPAEDVALTPQEGPEGSEKQPVPTGINRVEPVLIYEFTPSDQIQLNFWGRIFLGRTGKVVTRSWGGVLWAGQLLTGFLLILSVLFLVWTMSQVKRPVQAADLAGLMILGIFAFTIWRMQLRPLIWLVEDRIIPASETLTKFTEEPCQLDMAKDGDHRYIRVVRYSGVCPLCAGKIELRYGHGDNARRLFGCCTEVPQEHVFEFDRVTRMGRRYIR